MKDHVNYKTTRSVWEGQPDSSSRELVLNAIEALCLQKNCTVIPKDISTSSCLVSDLKMTISDINSILSMIGIQLRITEKQFKDIRKVANLIDIVEENICN